MFNVGDEVEVIDDYNYSITKVGSWGVVVESNDRYTRVEFKYVPYDSLDTFTIDNEHLKLRKTYSQEEKVCMKIRSIYARQGRKTKLPCFC